VDREIEEDMWSGYVSDSEGSDRWFKNGDWIMFEANTGDEGTDEDVFKKTLAVIYDAAYRKSYKSVNVQLYAPPDGSGAGANGKTTYKPTEQWNVPISRLSGPLSPKFIDVVTPAKRRAPGGGRYIPLEIRAVHVDKLFKALEQRYM